MDTKYIEFKQIIVKIKQPLRQTSSIAMLVMANIAIYMRFNSLDSAQGWSFQPDLFLFVE